MSSRISRFFSNQPRVLLMAALLACVCINYNNLFLDFWNDEIYSLQQFQLVPFITTLTDYHDVNNHIGFNLLCNLYLKATGQQDFLTLLLHPERLRILLLLITCGTVWVLWKLSMELGGIRLALINLILLLTTLPFYNFTMQLRGYGLAILLVLVIIRYLYHYYQTQHWRQVLGLATFVTVLFYVHPANVYFILSLYPAAALLAWLTPEWSRQAQLSFTLRIWIALTAGAVAGVLLYLPMAQQLFFSPLTGGLKSFYWGFFKSGLLANTHFFISLRYLAVMAAVAGFYVGIIRKNPALPKTARFFWCFVVLYLLPYIIAFLRKDALITRVFIPGVGLFILMMGLCIYWLDHAMKPKLRMPVVVLIMGSFMVVFPLDILRRNHEIDQSNHTTMRTENLSSNHYSHYFNQRDILRMAKEHASEKEFLLLCLVGNSVEMQEYLKAAHIRFYQYPQMKRITAGRKSWYLITSNTVFFKERFPRWRLRKMNTGFYYANFYLVTRQE